MSTYNDPFISLKNIALTQFEGARDVPASIDLLVKEPNKLDIQARTLLLRLNAALTNFKIPKIAVVVGKVTSSILAVFAIGRGSFFAT